MKRREQHQQIHRKARMANKRRIAVAVFENLLGE